MIHTIEGKLQEKQPTFAIVNVNGVGYGIHIALTTFERLGEHGSNVFLHTYLHVREEALQLYGFYTTEEREMFLALTSVSGIGPKLGIGILSGVSVHDFCELIRQGNAAKIKRIPGIGAKTADRLILELKSKVDKISSGDSSVKATSLNNHTEEAILALQSLGYKPADAQKAINAHAASILPTTPLEEIIRLALQKLM